MPWPKDTLTQNCINMQSLPNIKNQYFSIAYKIAASPGVWDSPQPIPNFSVYILYLSHTRVLPCPELSMVIEFGSCQCRIFQTYARWPKSSHNLQNPVQKSVPLYNLLLASLFEFVFPFFELSWYSVTEVYMMFSTI